MPGGDFTLWELTAQASLNRVAVGDIGCQEITGMRAEEACSRMPSVRSPRTAA
ncbi:MAG: hypothetical protein ACRDTH_00885 [Pseudonocardiaceae bacterium]